MADNRLKVTIYSRSEMMGNIIKIEAHLVAHGRKRYAQHHNAPFMTFIPKRKRIGRTLHKGYDPYFIIIEGWGHPEPGSMWLPTDHSGSLPVKRGKHSGCSPNWVKDFEADLGAYLASDKVTVIADYRNGSPTETPITYTEEELRNEAKRFKGYPLAALSMISCDYWYPIVNHEGRLTGEILPGDDAEGYTITPDTLAMIAS